MSLNNFDAARSIYKKKDDAHWERLEKIISNSKLSTKEMLINFPSFIRRRDLTRVLSDYELFKLIVDRPGSIAELGVYLGAGLFTWSKFLETFCPCDRSRKVYGFESFQGYRQIGVNDRRPEEWIANVVGEKVAEENFLEEMVRLTNDDNLIPGAERCRLIKGDVLETLPKFIEENQGTRFCLIFLDVNLYAPTLAGLRALYPLLVPGGVVALNGFGSPPWEGESKAVEDYFVKSGFALPKLRKFEFSIRPGAYFIKE